MCNEHIYFIIKQWYTYTNRCINNCGTFHFYKISGMTTVTCYSHSGLSRVLIVVAWLDCRRSGKALSIFYLWSSSVSNALYEVRYCCDEGWQFISKKFFLKCTLHLASERSRLCCIENYLYPSIGTTEDTSHHFSNLMYSSSFRS
jgi:hypothetical protein